MTCRTLRVVSAALMVLGVLSGLGALWWWALYGMSANVGLAWIFTALLVAGIGGLMWLAAGIMELSS